MKHVLEFMSTGETKGRKTLGEAHKRDSSEVLLAVAVGVAQENPIKMTFRQSLEVDVISGKAFQEEETTSANSEHGWSLQEVQGGLCGKSRVNEG